MIGRSLFVLFYAMSMGAYLILSNESAVRWHNVFVSVVGVIAVFVFIGRFVEKKAAPRARKIFLRVLGILNVVYGIMILLNFTKGWYANAFLTAVFIAPMSALLVECKIREKAADQKGKSDCQVQK